MENKSKVRLLFILIGVCCLGIFAVIVEQMIKGELLYICVGSVFLLLLLIWVIKAIIEKCKMINSNKYRTSNGNAKIKYGNHVKDLIDFEFDFGDFGVVQREKVNCDNIPRLNNNVDDIESVNYSINIAKQWSERVAKNKIFFVNYFMYEVLQSVENLNIKFWEKYRLNKDDLTNEECYALFKKVNNESFNKDLEKYLDVKKQVSIKKVFDKFDFFDYDSFVKGLTIEIAFSGDDCLCVMIKDKHESVMDVFEVFDKDLNGLDYHNDVIRTTLIV